MQLVKYLVELHEPDCECNRIDARVNSCHVMAQGFEQVAEVMAFPIALLKTYTAKLFFDKGITGVKIKDDKYVLLLEKLVLKSFS